MTHEEPMHRTDPDRGAALDQPRLNLYQGHVSLLGDQLGTSIYPTDLSSLAK